MSDNNIVLDDMDFHHYLYTADLEGKVTLSKSVMYAIVNLINQQNVKIEALQEVKKQLEADVFNAEMNRDYFREELLNEDFDTILICAVRYALGRRTYITGLVADFVERLLPEISDKALSVIRRDIETAGNYGDEQIDKPYWMQLLLKIQEEQRRRTGRKDE